MSWEVGRVLLGLPKSGTPRKPARLHQCFSLGPYPGADTLTDYGGHNACGLLYQYDLTTFRGNVVMDALKTHPICVSNVIERAVILSQGPSLELGDWSPQAV